MNKLNYNRQWGTYNGKNTLDGVTVYGNYNPDTKECYLVMRQKNIHFVLVSVCEFRGELTGELYNGFDYDIAREILGLGHLTKATATAFHKAFGYDFECKEG